MAIDIRSLQNNTAPGLTSDDSSPQAGQAGSFVPPGLLPQALGPSPASASSEPGVAGAKRVGAADSMGPAAATMPAAGVYTAMAPELPDVEGPRAAPTHTAAVLEAAFAPAGTAPGGAPISSAMMFQILQDAANKGYELQTKLHHVANLNVFGAKQAEVTHLKEQIAGEQKSAGLALAGAFVSAGIGMGGTMRGTQLKTGKASPASTHSKTENLDASASQTSDKMPAARISRAQGSTKDKVLENQLKQEQPKDPGAAHRVTSKRDSDQESQASSANPTVPGKDNAQRHAKADGQVEHVSEPRHLALGTGLEQSSMAIGTAVSSAIDLADKMAGGKHEADQARIAQKVDQLKAQIAQTVADGTKSGVDSALENYKAAQTLVQNYTQRWTEVNNNIANK